MSQKLTYNALILLFPGADILDYAGPIEILTHALHNRNPEAPDPIFSISTVARDGLASVLTGKGGLTIQPTTTISRVLANGGLGDVDLLIVPGGPPNIMQGLLTGQELELVKAFVAGEGGVAEQRKEKGRGERILMSVCTGAFLLAATGVLEGKEATTHHRALDTLREMGGGKIAVIGGKRVVDAGIVGTGGLRVITSGGVSSGLDATLYLVEHLAGADTAAFIARVMEYEKRDS